MKPASQRQRRPCGYVLAGIVTACAAWHGPASQAAPIPDPGFDRLPPISTRTVSRRTGQVLFTTRAWIEPAERDGEQLVAVRSRTFQPIGTTVDTRTLVRSGATVRCLEREERVTNAAGETLALEMRQFRREALYFPADNLPDDTYPPSEILLYLLGHLPTDGEGRGSFHVLGETQVWKMDVWERGTEEISVPAGRFRCRRLRMRPDPESLGFPAFLRPFVRYFVPEFEAWVSAEKPHLAVRLEGPLGPPKDRDVMVELLTTEPPR